MKSHKITFKLSPYQLARGLQVIRQLEPSYKLISLNDIVKTVYHDYLAKMTINKLDTVPQDIMNEVTNYINNPPNNQITLKELTQLKNQPPEPSKEPDPIKQKITQLKPLPIKQIILPKPRPELSDEILAEINKISKLSKPIKPEEEKSTISAVSDFSPPKDWME